MIRPLFSLKGSHRREELPCVKALSYAGLSKEETHTLVSAVADHSPFLYAQLCHIEEHELCDDFFQKSPCEFFSFLREKLEFFHKKNNSFEALSRELRWLRHRTLLSIALADLAGELDMKEATALISDLAEYGVESALTFLIRQSRSRGVFNEEKSGHDSYEILSRGYTVLGMGKLGARELNFSSDIDLIILYDCEAIGFCNPEKVQEEANRLTRKLCKLINDKTKYGHVFRTDLRLRPDPSSNPIAVNIRTAEVYYERLGRNWERAAMLKARPIAGDKALGGRFLEGLRPFIWRRHLDFDALRDIFFLQKQRTGRTGTVKVRGANVKLSEGGIRDVEFFVQSLQLVWGGRKPDLRCSPSLEALTCLYKARLMSLEDHKTLHDSYVSLRMLEHRLQMLRDEQTHTLPDNEEEFAEFGRFCGFEDGKSFAEFVETLMGKVWDIVTQQVQTFNPKTGDEQSLCPVASSAEEDTDALQKEALELFAGFSWHGDDKIEGNTRFLNAIAERGYDRPEEVLRVVQGWYKGQHNKSAATSDISRRFLLDVLPTLLRRLSQARDPQNALIRFDRFVHQMPIGFSLFSVLGSHPQLMEALTTVIGNVPRIANSLSEKPALIYALLAEEGEKKSLDVIEKELDDHLHDAKYEEDVLVLSRRYLHEQQFRCEWAWMEGTITQEKALARYTALHEAVLKRVIALAEREKEEGSLAVWAFGRLGCHAMMPESDYDLVFVHKPKGGEEEESHFAHHQRLVRRVTAFIESKTREGVLGQVDLRLRPYGKSGALSQSFDTLCAYYREKKAWIVEYMALCHARAFYGSSSFIEQLESLRDESLRLTFEKEEVREEVRRVLGLAYTQHLSEKGYSVKYAKGGLFDLEFFTQYGLLLKGGGGECLPYGTRDQLTYLENEGFIDASCGKRLQEAWKLMTGAQAFVRLTGWDWECEDKDLRDVALKKMCGQKGEDVMARLCDDNAYIRDLMTKEKIAPDV